MPTRNRTPAFADDIPPTQPVAPAPPPAPQPVPAPSRDIAVPTQEPPRQDRPTSQLASLLVGSDGSGTPNGGPAIPVSTLLGAGRPVDPDDPDQRVGIGPQIPRYLRNALRLAAFASGVEQNQLIADGLRATLPKALVDQAYEEEARRLGNR
jgi:hypothetical protein